MRAHKYVHVCVCVHISSYEKSPFRPPALILQNVAADPFFMCCAHFRYCCFSLLALFLCQIIAIITLEHGDCGLHTNSLVPAWWLQQQHNDSNNNDATSVEKLNDWRTGQCQYQCQCRLLFYSYHASPSEPPTHIHTQQYWSPVFWDRISQNSAANLKGGIERGEEELTRR